MDMMNAKPSEVRHQIRAGRITGQTSGMCKGYGIEDLSKPDYGEMVTIKDGEVPVFWPCGVTPQNIIMNSRPDFVITHAPGHMLITDTKNINLKF